MKTIVFIPTYNERENVELIYKEINQLNLKLDILFADDNSPDGTGQVLDQMANQNENIHVIHRPEKMGVGAAHQAGILWAYEHGYDRLLTMDCDFTHDPKDIPRFLETVDQADLVVSSRYIRKNSLKEWTLFRKCLTHLGHLLTRFFLKIPYDATNSFRLYNLRSIPHGVFPIVESKSYSFFFESLFVILCNGHTVKEIPIDLPARTYGHSKMKVSDALGSVKMLLQLCLRKMTRPEDFIYVEPLAKFEQSDFGEEALAWDRYWSKEPKLGIYYIYEICAAFYRQLLIKPLFNSFVRKTFPDGSKLLHAGCGSGQVDQDISFDMQITALDISDQALERYHRGHPHASLVKASILDTNLPDRSFDGVYNLGVMEHFEETDIESILLEFKRIMKPEGRLLMFWPPEFGFSVNVLKALQFLINLFNKQVKLFPNEISRIKSRRHVEGIVERAGFRITEYYFGPKDFFTQVALVCEKA